MKELTQQQIDHVLDLVANNEKVAAVKFVVEQSQIGLKEAKDWVELLMEQPDAALYSMNLTPFASDPSKRKMSSIQTHYSSRQVFIKYDNGENVEIDEFHPEWNAAMSMFGRSKTYSTKDEFLDAMQQASDEMLKQTPSSNLNSAPLHHPPQEHSNVRATRSSGVEDLSEKNNYTNLIILLAGVLLAVAIASYLLQ